MRCRYCNSIDTRVTVTRHNKNETWRYCRCLDCKAKFKTVETYDIPKRGSAPGVPQHTNCVKKGEDNGKSVLTEKNILTIRSLAEDKVKYELIAEQFGIHKQTVYRIVKRKLWSHVQ